MKFAYVYKLADGTRHEAVMRAKSRDEAFAALRKRGIRPVKVEPAGWLYVHRAQVRHTVLAILLSVIAVLMATLWLGRPEMLQGPSDSQQSAMSRAADPRAAEPRPRRQVPGFDQVDLVMAFAHPFERYLAGFAQPGVRRKASSAKASSALLEDDLTEALEDEILIEDGDEEAVVEIKRIVAGLKEEVAMLVAAGKCMREICEWLEGRQHMECEYRSQLLQGPGSPVEKNSRLKAMGFAEAD